LFAFLFIAMALFLLSQLGEQAKFSSKGKLFAQPAFWPGVGVIGMVVFGGLNFIAELFAKPRPDNRWRTELKEGASWMFAVEYLAWFMVYVSLTPVIGYLLSTMLFMLALTLRAGFRQWRMALVAVVTGFAIVLVFKSFLGVKIPGAEIYEALPNALRTFMIVNF